MRLNGIDQLSRDTAIAVGDSAIILRTTDGGSHWIPLFGGQNMLLHDIKMIDSDRGVAVGAGYILRTTDQGTTWTFRPSDVFDDFTGVAFADKDHAMAAGSTGKIGSSSDAGATWKAIWTDSKYSFNGIASFGRSRYSAVGMFPRHVGMILRTTDDGLDWGMPHDNDGQYVQDISFTDSLNGLAVGYSGLIVKTTDGGTVWTSLQTYTWLYLFGLAIPRQGRAIIVGLNGVILEVPYSEAMIVDEANTSPRATAYSLSQNYPNPFNPTTRIDFAVSSRGNVTIIVYDVLGRAVQMLLNEIKVPGLYSVEWDATSLPSGVYVYQLSTGSFVEQKKMVLIK